jgi:Ca2+-dependent lipid-binding protein
MIMFVEEARLTHDTEVIGKMDPYCKIEYAGKKYKTHTKDEAGMTPKWKFKMDLYVKDINDDISFKVMDEDTLVDDKVGSVKCKIKDILGSSDFEHVKWLDLIYDGKKAG